MAKSTTKTEAPAAEPTPAPVQSPPTIPRRFTAEAEAYAWDNVIKLPLWDAFGYLTMRFPQAPGPHNPAAENDARLGTFSSRYVLRTNSIGQILYFAEAGKSTDTHRKRFHPRVGEADFELTGTGYEDEIACMIGKVLFLWGQKAQARGWFERSCEKASRRSRAALDSACMLFDFYGVKAWGEA